MDRWWTKTQCTYPQQEPFGSPKFLVFLSTHATLFVDPGRPSESSPIRSLCAGFWYRYTIATCIILGNEAVSRLQGVRSPLWPMWFPVYASAVSFGFCLLHNCNTRYGWLVRPFPSGTFTLQETPSFLAHNGLELSRPARSFACYSRFPYQLHRYQIAPPAGSAAANGYAPLNRLYFVSREVDALTAVNFTLITLP